MCDFRFFTKVLVRFCPVVSEENRRFEICMVGTHFRMLGFVSYSVSERELLVVLSRREKNVFFIFDISISHFRISLFPYVFVKVCLVVRLPQGKP